MGNVADKIDNNIWLGECIGITDATCSVLEKYSIDIVITAQTLREVNEENLSKYIRPPRQWFHFNIDDTNETLISKYFEEVHTIIQTAKRQGKCIYIHCRSGISRSPTLVAAHLMLENNWSRKTAIEYITKHRHQIDPNDGFMNQLKILEDQIRRRLEKDGCTLDGDCNSSNSLPCRSFDPLSHTHECSG